VFQMLPFCNVLFSLTRELVNDVYESLWYFVLAALQYALIDNDEIGRFGVLRNLPVAAQAVDKFG